MMMQLVAPTKSVGVILTSMNGIIYSFLFLFLKV
jgi:hypothetical protein